jgi:glycosyltransferase involved in cell wall biosynthesis
MPVFNNEKYLPSAVESILNQTMGDFEFLITDDGSTDNSFAILNKYARKDDRIVLFHQQNRGIAATLNQMIGHAQGSLIARMDSDDISRPTRFDEQIAYMNQHPHCLAAGCWVQRIDENGVAMVEVHYPDDHKTLKRLLDHRQNCFTHGSVMLRRLVFDDLKLFYRFHYGEDYDLWLRVAEKGLLGMLTKPLYQYREHTSHLTQQYKSIQNRIMDLRLQLSRERCRFGHEQTDWQKEEADILRGNNPITSGSATENSYLYCRALIELYRGNAKNSRAMQKNIKKKLYIYLVSFLPAFIVLFFVFLRQLFSRRWRYLRFVRGQQ